MTDKNYTTSIQTNASPEDVIDKISKVSEWWAKDFNGSSNNVGDIFTVKFGSGDTFTIKITEVLPEVKIVWEVIDAYQGWVKDPKEWVGTKIVWEVTKVKDATEIHFTHLGLVPQLECFGTCTNVWGYLIQKSLSSLLNNGKGLPA